jgi:hypothetical protein
MKVHIVVTDPSGQVFEGDATLTSVGVGARRRKRPASLKETQPRTHAPDLSLPLRPFMNEHARRLSGAAKFTLLLAWLTKGKIGETKSRREIEKAWNGMTALMGGTFNSAHAVRAKDRGWVDSPKSGSFVLLNRWAHAVGNR